MKLAVLTSPDSWYWKDLTRAAGDRHQLHCLPFTQIATHLHGSKQCFNCNGSDLTSFDGVLVRTMPPGSLEQVVFRMNALGQLEQSGVAVINSPRSLEAAVDKYLTSAKLQASGLLVPKTMICQTVEQAMNAFHELGGDVVVKPLFGGEGRGIFRVEDESLALRAVKSLVQLNAVLYLQQFIDHPGYDIRILVIGNNLLAVRRRNDDDWRTNVTRGACAEPIELDDDLVETARRATAAVGATIAGVDILPDGRGERYVLEVNAVPGWKGLGRALDTDVAAMILNEIESIVESNKSTA